MTENRRTKAETTIRTMTKEAMSVSEIVDENGTIGHGEAMRRLGPACCADLIETMRLNGRRIWAHKPMGVNPAAAALIKEACAPSI